MLEKITKMCIFIFRNKTFSKRAVWSIDIKKMKKTWKTQLTWKNRKKFEIEFISIPLTQESQYLSKQYKVEQYFCRLKISFLKILKKKKYILHISKSYLPIYVTRQEKHDDQISRRISDFSYFIFHQNLMLVKTSTIEHVCLQMYCKLLCNSKHKSVHLPVIYST